MQQHTTEDDAKRGARHGTALNGHLTNNGTDAAPIYAYSRFRSKTDNAPKAARHTWPQLCELLSRRAIREEKDGPLFSGASYPPDTPRGNEGVAFVSVAIFDFDDGAALDEIEAGVSRLNFGDGGAAFIYSTHSHEPDVGALKYRLTLPLLEPVAGADWPRVWKRLALHFGGAPDEKAKDAARIHFLPSCPPSREQFAVAVELGGPALDVATLPELPPDDTPPEARELPAIALSDARGDNYARKAFESEIGRLCATTGNRNDALNCTARRLGQFIGAGRLDRSEVEAALMDACRVNGYFAKDGEAEARATMKSGLDAGQPEPNRKGMPEERFQRNGHVALRSTPDNSEKLEIFETFTFDDMENEPRARWLVRSVIREGQASLLSGDTGTFKSFVELEQCLCVATGTPFFGLEVLQGAVVYIAAEGYEDLKDRAKAWAQVRGVPLPSNFHAIRVPVNVGDMATAARLIRTVQNIAPVLIVLDTLSQNALGLKENSNDDMALFVAGMMHVGAEVGAHVQVVHHNGRESGVFRGAGAIKYNVHTHISLERPEADDTQTVFIRCEKQKGKPFAPFALRGEEVVVEGVEDEYGEAITSLVFHVAQAAEIPTAKHGQTKKADKTREKLLELFDELFDEHGGVKIGSWKAKVEEAQIPKCASDSTFWAYRKKLETEGVIEFFDHHNGSELYRRAPKSGSTLRTPRTPKSESEELGVNSENSNNPLGVGVLGVTAPSVKAPASKKHAKARAEIDSEPYVALEPDDDAAGVDIE